MRATILVVDDDRSTRKLLSTVLRQEGHQVVEACDGAVALEILQALRCDLMITDLVMPKLNGLGLVEQLHSLQPQMPIIFITGYLSAISDKTIVDEAAEFLPKPLSLMFYGQLSSACLRQLPTQPSNP
jgi:CheY-like chemotaxis protein